MANLQLVAQWAPTIYQLATTDPVLGGEAGVSNQQAKELGNRTEYLKSELEKLAEALSEIHPVGEVQMIVAPAYNAADYDGTGLGKIGTPAQGWALCNGQNATTDLRGRFVVGMNPDNPDYVYGATGGEERHTLTIDEMPRHTHGFRPYQAVTRQGDNGTNRTTLDTGYRDNMTTEPAGSSQPHENRPPFFALVFRQRVQN